MSNPDAHLIASVDNYLTQPVASSASGKDIACDWEVHSLTLPYGPCGVAEERPVHVNSIADAKERLRLVPFDALMVAVQKLMNHTALALGL